MPTPANKSADICQVPECINPMTHDAPGCWCDEHWQMWFDWPEQEPEPPWMAAGRDHTPESKD
jgi:hypothetical protein